jgi:hypothetical protein
VGLLWTSVRPVAETSTWQHATLTRREIHAFGRNQTSNPSKLAVAYPHLRQRGHWSRSLKMHSLKIKRKHLFHFASFSFSTLFRFAHLQMACSILAYLFRVLCSPFVNFTTLGSLSFIGIRFLETSLPSHIHCNLIWLRTVPKSKNLFRLNQYQPFKAGDFRLPVQKINIGGRCVMYCNGVHIRTFQTRFVTLRSVLGLLCLEGRYRCIIEVSDNCEPNVNKWRCYIIRYSL